MTTIVIPEYALSYLGEKTEEKIKKLKPKDGLALVIGQTVYLLTVDKIKNAADVRWEKNE